MDDLITFCREKDIDIVVLPLLWIGSIRTQPERGRAVLRQKRFCVRKVFYYLNEPAIVVAEFLGGPGP